MLNLIIRRLLSLIPLLVLISVLVFFLMNLAPGDALDEFRARKDVSPALIAQLERQYGYKDSQGQPNPAYVRYFHWVNTVSPVKFVDDNGDFTWRLHFGPPSLGDSFEYRVPVTTLLMQRVPATLTLEITSLIFAWGLAVPLGVLAAIKKDSWIDRLTTLLAYAALSVPEYFLGLLLLIPAAHTGWLPIGGRSSFDSDFYHPGARFWDYAWHLVLPTFALGIGTVAAMMRVMRVSMLDYLRAEFVTTARAKGVPEGRIMFLHVLRNAFNPLVTTLGFALGSLLSGALLIEIVLNYPGLGRLIYDAFLRHDEYVVIASVLIGTIILVLGNLAADILLALLDPRIRLEQKNTGSVAHRRGGTWALVAAAAVILALGLGIYALPWDNTDAMDKVMGRIEFVGAAILLTAGGVLLWVAIPVLKKLAASLPRQPITALAALTLALLYGCALLAPVLATRPIDQINLKNTFHPPTRLVWQDGRLWAQVYENVDPPSAHYEPKAGELIPLKFFGRGFEYKLWGLFSSSRHLLVPDYDALAVKLGHPVDPGDYPFYLLGSDTTGRDMFSRLLYGSQISLTIGLVGIAITMVMGFLVGGLSGYFGGSFDFFAMRFVEFLLAMPTLYLLLALRAALAPHFGSGEMYLVIIVILSLIGWAGTARVLRGMSLSLRERPFVTAAECMGQNSLTILFKHFLPNLAGYLLVAATLSIPGYILGEAALSFLGLG
ncbi:MAG TPA: ABC transporter permease subunit, partial [Opitutales bacterium]|nr:ABC transporter permease subunit [Opitutales bacterium]